MYAAAFVSIAALAEPRGVLLTSVFPSELLKAIFPVLFVSGTDYVSCLLVKEVPLGWGGKQPLLHVTGGDLAGR